MRTCTLFFLAQLTTKIEFVITTKDDVVNGNSSSIAGERHSAAINIGNDSNSVQAPKTAGERHTAEQVFKV